MLMKTPPDLTHPSWEGISYLLRHKELWPANFQWNFCGSSQCAIGLSYKIWGTHMDPIGECGDTFNPYAMGEHAPVPDRKVTPEMVADKIDDYLAKNPIG